MDKDVLEEANALADRLIANGELFTNLEYEKLRAIAHENYITKRNA